jgi:4-carboxymuconolactone decarboxylase
LARPIAHFGKSHEDLLVVSRPTACCGSKARGVDREVVFGDVWERPDLSKRERSIATVTALITSARWDQLNGHLERATNNGVSKAEIFELITHLAFYAGWPSAMTAASKAKEFYEKRDAQK